MTFIRSGNGGLITGGGAGVVSPTIGLSDAILHSITLTDTSGAGSTGLHRVGLAFEKGDVPSGSILEAEIATAPIRSSMLNTNTWSDGSLRSCILCMDAGTFTASQSKTIDVHAKLGSQSASSISGGAFGYLGGLTDDLTVEIRNHTGTTNSTNVGNLDFSMQTAIGTATRREIQDDTDLCVRVFAWQQVSPDEHLTCLHYIDIWLDTDGATPIAYEWTPVISQHWWVDDPLGTAMTKQERNYDATIKDGTTTLVSHTGLNHAYYCQWAGLRTDNDDQHAQRFWIADGSAMPTLRRSLTDASWTRMMKAGYIPPLDLSQTYTGDLFTNTDGSFSGGNNDTLATPLLSNGNKTGINGTGGYPGRGVITDPDAKAIQLQTANRWREMRVMAQDSLAVHHHIKDHRNASGGAFNGDASMGLFPQEFATLGAQSYTGLAAEATIVTGTGGDLADDAPNNASNAPRATGGFGSWDDAHHVVYAYFAAFIEGERYLADAVLDQLNYVNTQGSFDGFVSDPAILWVVDDSDRKTDLSLPTSTYGFVHIRHRQERSFGWTQLGLDHAYALLADSDRHKPWLENAMAVADDWLSDSTDAANLPASQLTTGTVWMRNPPLISSFMNTMTAQCFSRSIVLHEGAYPGFTEYERLIMRYFRDCAINAPYTLGAQDHLVCTDDEDAQTYIGRTDRYINNGRATIDNTDTPGTWFNMQNRFEDNIIPAVNDVCQFAVGTTSTPLPTGASLGVDYHVVQIRNTGVDDCDVKISATQGGSAIEVTSTASETRLLFKLPGHSQTQLGDNSTEIPIDDDNLTIAWAALEYHYGRGGAEISAGDMSTIRTFFAPKSFSNFAPWALDGDNLL